MFLLPFYHVLWRCELKPPQNGNLKKPIIDLSRNIIHTDAYTTFIFPQAFGLQRSFGHLVKVYYLMPNVLVALKITKVGISCIYLNITCDSGPYSSNFITSTTLRKKIMITQNIDSKSPLTFSS